MALLGSRFEKQCHFRCESPISCLMGAELRKNKKLPKWSHFGFLLFSLGHLRVLASYEAQNRPLFYIFVDSFINSQSFKNLNVHSDFLYVAY